MTQELFTYYKDKLSIPYPLVAFLASFLIDCPAVGANGNKTPPKHLYKTVHISIAGINHLNTRRLPSKELVGIQWTNPNITASTYYLYLT